MEKFEERHPEVAHLVTGHFHEATGYATWRSHGTDDWLLIATLGGQGRFGFENGEFLATPGDLILYRPRVCHDYAVAPEPGHWELLWTHFHPRPDWAPWLLWPELASGIMCLQPEDAGALDKIIRRLEDANALATGLLPAAQRHRETFAMNALEEVLLWCDTQNPLSESSQLDGASARSDGVSGQAPGRADQPRRFGVSLQPVGVAPGTSLSRPGRRDPAAVFGRPAASPGKAVIGADSALNQRNRRRSGV